MTEVIQLAQKREELKSQIAAGKYRTLVDLILDGIGYFIQKLSRNPRPIPFWFSALVIALAMLGLALLPLIISGRPNPQWEVLLGAEISSIVVAFIVITSVKLSIRLLLTTWHDHLLDAVVSEANLANFQGWLATFTDLKKPLIFSLAYGILIGVMPSLYAAPRATFVGFEPVILFFITFFQGGLGVYYFFLVLLLSARISQYHFKLYAADPSSSEVIFHLSGLLSIIVYLAAANIAIATVSFLTTLRFGLTLQFIIILILIWWVPLTIFFIINQYSLYRIISMAKWGTLNKIQAKIENLQDEANITDKETLETINRLTTYHDQIKATPNSALNFRTGMNFVNSLLLPPLAFVLANLEIILGFLS